MNKLSLIEKDTPLCYAVEHLNLLFISFMLFLLLVGVFKDACSVFVLILLFILVQMVLQFLFYFNMEYPTMYTINGYKYKRVQGKIKGNHLDEWSFLQMNTYYLQIFLYTFGIKRTIIIVACKETEDVKVLCPYCKNIIEVEDVVERCPYCHKKLHDDIIPPFFP